MASSSPSKSAAAVPDDVPSSHHSVAAAVHVSDKAFPLFDEEEYTELRTHYLEKRMWSKQLTDGICLRRKPKASRIDCEQGPGWEALRKRIAMLETTKHNNHKEIYRLLSQLKQWEQLRGVFPVIDNSADDELQKIGHVVDLTDIPDDEEIVDVDSYIIDVLLVKVVKADPDSVPTDNNNYNEPDANSATALATTSNVVVKTEPRDFVEESVAGGERKTDEDNGEQTLDKQVEDNADKKIFASSNERKKGKSTSGQQKSEQIKESTIGADDAASMSASKSEEDFYEELYTKAAYGKHYHCGSCLKRRNGYDQRWRSSQSLWRCLYYDKCADDFHRYAEAYVAREKAFVEHGFSKTFLARYAAVAGAMLDDSEDFKYDEEFWAEEDSEGDVHTTGKIDSRGLYRCYCRCCVKIVGFIPLPRARPRRVLPCRCLCCALRPHAEEFYHYATVADVYVESDSDAHDRTCKEALFLALVFDGEDEAKIGHTKQAPQQARKLFKLFFGESLSDHDEESDSSGESLRDDDDDESEDGSTEPEAI